MNKKQIITFGGATILAGFVVGAIYSGLAADLVNPGRSLSDSYENKTLLNATTTAGNPSRHATSSAIQIGGAKKINLQLYTVATSTTKTTDFLVYVSVDPTIYEGNGANDLNSINYQRFNDLVPSSTTTPNLYTNNHKDSRYGIISVADGATTTAAMDLQYRGFRTMVCVASSSPHLISSCKAYIEY